MYMKRLMQSVSGLVVNQQVCIAMSGVAKVFVGELVEEALKVAVSIFYFVVTVDKVQTSFLNPDPTTYNAPLKASTDLKSTPTCSEIWVK